MRENAPHVRTVAVEPYAGHAIQGLKNMQASYPPGIYEKRALNRIIRIEDEHAFDLCRTMARTEGIFSGMSSGAALGGALQLASELEEGLVVVLLPDGGERYLSTPLFASPLKQGMLLENLRGQKKEYLDLHSGRLNAFTPGPPADDCGDLETWRRIVFLDVLQRYLRARDMRSSVYVGLADLDDQAVLRAREHGLSLERHSAVFRERVRELADRLGAGDLVICSASAQEELMLSMCQRLLDKGRGYEKLRSVYFDISRDSDYGLLAGADLSRISLGKTVDLEDYAKENPEDFTLLKRASLQDIKQGEFIKTKWGNVRPSWYLQMAAAPGDAVDGLDLVQAGGTHHFPHLDNLRAIWSVAPGRVPRIWSVVQGGVGRQEDVFLPDMESLLHKRHPRAVRMWLLSNAYRRQLVYSSESLDMWESNWRRVQTMAVNAYHLGREASGEVSRDVEQTVFQVRQSFTDLIEDDLSLYRFWPVLFDLCKRINARYARGQLTPAEAARVLGRLRELDAVLCLVDWCRMPLTPEEIPPDTQQMLTERGQAQRERDFSRADELRDRIAEQGYAVEDSPYGPRIFTSN
jgi:cysteinyl-tRNA synthetase